MTLWTRLLRRHESAVDVGAISYQTHSQSTGKARRVLDWWRDRTASVDGFLKPERPRTRYGGLPCNVPAKSAAVPRS